MLPCSAYIGTRNSATATKRLDLASSICIGLAGISWIAWINFEKFCREVRSVLDRALLINGPEDEAAGARILAVKNTGREGVSAAFRVRT